MTEQKKTRKKPVERVECVALVNLCCDYQVKKGETFTCTPEQQAHFKKVKAV
jgi:hypothetical protein